MTIGIETDRLSLVELERHDPGAPRGSGRERRFLCPFPACADKLLTMAACVDAAPDGLYAVLHGARCCGVRLTVDGGGGRLLPGEMEDEYAAFREEYLAPRASGLRGLLLQLEAQN